MKLTLVISLVVTYIALSQSRSLNSVSPLVEFDRAEHLSSEVQVAWHVNTATKLVTFQVVAQTTGWVGFGISKNGTMTGADIVFGGVKEGKSYFDDRFSTGHSEPVADTKQDWKLITATEDATYGTTSLKFERLFDTGDATQDIPITDASVYFIWAIGANDTIGEHKARGFFPVNILKPDDPPTEYGPDFERSQQLGEDCSVTWQVYKSLKKVIFEVEAVTTGYVAFGISNNGSMSNADLVIGGIKDDYTPYFSASFSAGPHPSVDPVQNWKFLEGREVGNKTYLKFVRSFVSSDPATSIAITDASTYFIWAVGTSDDLSKEHTSHGSYRVNILKEKKINFGQVQLSENVTASWHVNFDQENVMFEVEAKTKGYIAFGFGESGAMPNADMIVGGVKDDLLPYFDDMYSTTHGQLIVDTQQDWTLLAASEDLTTTYLRFIRSFNTGDSAQDNQILDVDTNFIWALGSDDDVKKEHASRGSYKINIMQPSIVTPVPTSPAPIPTNFVRQERINENLTVQWEVDFVSERITFEIKALTPGYIGFGIGDAGTMFDADLIIGGVDDEGVAYFSDRYSSSHGVEPALDAYQNWFLISASQHVNVTTIRFVRGFDTGDKDGDFAIENRLTNLIWALGSSDDITRHAARGSYPVNLLQAPVGVPPTSPAPPPPANFVRQERINENLTVQWEVDFVSERITFETKALTTGYIGFGIGDAGTMFEADLIIGGVDDEGVAYFTDRFSVSHGVEPAIDTYQNWFLISASERASLTTLRFVRGFNTGDKDGDFAIEDRSTNIIWALGSSDDITRHATRGSYAVNLLEPSLSGPPTTPGSSACENVYTRSAQLTAGYGVTWDVDVINQFVTFNVEVKTEGFIGFGFSDSPSMINADLVYGGVKDGKSYFEDMFATGNTRPTKDKEQNWVLSSATESKGTTTLKFGRKIVTTDPTEDRSIEDKVVYFIWSIGATDDFDYHDNNRGSFAVNILDCTNTGTWNPVPEIPSNSDDNSGVSVTLMSVVIVLASLVCFISGILLTWICFRSRIVAAANRRISDLEPITEKRF